MHPDRGIVQEPPFPLLTLRPPRPDCGARIVVDFFHRLERLVDYFAFTVRNDRMKTVSRGSIGLRTVTVSAFIAVFLVCALAAPFPAQEKRVPQTAGVDNSKMGPYRALAQLAYAVSQKGDHASAATLAKVLERTWDKAEDYGGDTALSKTNHALFDQIDKAMDQFISLFLDHPASAPDAAKLKSAYTQYLEKLKLAD